MDYDGPIQLKSPLNLPAKCPVLLLHMGKVPMEIEPYFAHGNKGPLLQVLPGNIQLRAGIGSNGAGVYSHHCQAVIRISGLQVQHSFVGFAIDGRKQDLPNAGIKGTLHHGIPVGRKTVHIKMRMGIYIVDHACKFRQSGRKFFKNAA
jgi:hypothetical protein